MVLIPPDSSQRLAKTRAKTGNNMRITLALLALTALAACGGVPLVPLI
jgi:hypothetical protein